MADRQDNLPGITPPRLREDGRAGDVPRTDRFGRLRGPWKRPARFPCDFSRANGMICDLEAVASWCTQDGATWKRYAPGVIAGGVMEQHHRCALHPLGEGL
jgi:hypothetical protein